MSEDLLHFLRELLRLPGLSGHETKVRERIHTQWEPLVDEIGASHLGSLHARKVGSGEAPRPTLMFAAHMDSIGMMATEVVEGFLRLTEVGGLDPRVLPGQLVTVHGREDLPGMIIHLPSHCLPASARGGPVGLQHLVVDTGLPAKEVQAKVRPGDLISFAQEPFQLNEGTLVGHSLDNRASIAALTVCLEELQLRQHLWDVVAVATTQEEESMAGAFTSGYSLRPSVAVAIDVTFGASPGIPEHMVFPLGKGPTNGWGPNLHPSVFESLKVAADRVEIPLTEEVMPQHSGTDAYALQIAAEGVPTGLVSIPLRYMHTPVEVVAMTDIRRAGRLLAEFAAGLKADFLETIVWD